MLKTTLVAAAVSAVVAAGSASAASGIGLTPWSQSHLTASAISQQGEIAALRERLNATRAHLRQVRACTYRQDITVGKVAVLDSGNNVVGYREALINNDITQSPDQTVLRVLAWSCPSPFNLP